MNVLFDTNVFLDIIQKREPFYSASNHALDQALSGRIMGFVSVQSLKDIFYFVCKKLGRADAFEVVEKISALFKLTDISPDDSLATLMSNFNDYEDGLINASAVRNGIDIILTRDDHGFIESDLLIVHPDELEKYLEPYVTLDSVTIG